MALFQDCSVLFELRGLSFKEKKKIKFAVTDNGGNMSYVPNKQCSLIVTTGVSSLSPSRLRNIVKHQIPVVGLDYVRQCLEANCRLPVDDYKLDISSLTNTPPSVNKADSKGGTRSGQVFTIVAVYTEKDRDLPQFPENYQVAKYSHFQKPNSRSWYLLELQSAKSDHLREYRVVRYWKDDIQSKKAAVRDQIMFMSSSEEAVKVYQQLIDSMTAEGLKQQTYVPEQVYEMGSAPFQQLLLEEKLNLGELSDEVGVFVELLWKESLGCIDLVLNTPVHKISLNDVTRAEGLLLQIQRKITQNNSEEVASLWSEYCSLLPPRSPVSVNMSTVSKQFDLCQRHLNVSEMTLGGTVLSSVGKYRALRCGIEEVDNGSSEFTAVTSLLQNSKAQVHQIFRVSRAPELQNFKSELGQIRPLLHSSSPHNFVGILSRGLLLPNVAVDQHGIQRTDAGNLGSGIYFSDDIKTALKYSQCSSTDGSRLLLVCDVALGALQGPPKERPESDPGPEGHDSVHGVHNTPRLQSEFMVPLINDSSNFLFKTPQVLSHLFTLKCYCSNVRGEEQGREHSSNSIQFNSIYLYSPKSQQQKCRQIVTTTKWQIKFEKLKKNPIGGKRETSRRTTVKEGSTPMDGQAVDVTRTDVCPDVIRSLSLWSQIDAFSRSVFVRCSFPCQGTADVNYPTANRHMLRTLAQAGGGAYEFFDPKSKHICAPACSSPKQLHALFNDCHTLVFGFVPHCTQATLLGDLGGQEIKTMVSTCELQKTKGTFLHKLTARAIIRDFEDGSLDSNAVLHEEKKAELKSLVIELSKEYSILSQFTSFVAIEERDSEEEGGFTDIPKLIAEEDVDFLPYITWAEEEEEMSDILDSQPMSQRENLMENHYFHFNCQNKVYWQPTGSVLLQGFGSRPIHSKILPCLFLIQVQFMISWTKDCSFNVCSPPAPAPSPRTVPQPQARPHPLPMDPTPRPPPKHRSYSQSRSLLFLLFMMKSFYSRCRPSPDGYWELTPAQADILKLLATLLVLQLMRLENIQVGQMLRTLFCLEDSICRPDHWEAVNRAVKWVCWADRQYPCVYSRLEFGLSWDSSTKQLLGAEKINKCSPLIGLNLNPNPYQGPIML
ncbi:hypothetical protein WMY93_013907 [Mugilogobius chulae]|uniref:Poly [ADP-ribose] polymerase n=1 Tax=Mugilogobius chulae TaxID=88201 RepID=A0AAW0PDN3_9GOBI